MRRHGNRDRERWVDDRTETLEPSRGPRTELDDDVMQVKNPHTTRGRRKSLGTWLVAATVAIWLGVMVITVGRFSQSDETAADRAVETEEVGSSIPPPARRRTRDPRLTPPAERTEAPAFTLPDMNGANATLADYSGQVLLLNFWATWCGPCRAEMPWFVDFEEAYAGDGFAVLGVSMDEPGWDIVRPFLDKQPVNYRIALADTAERAAPFGPMNILPKTWLVDRNGRIAAEHIGLVNRDAIENEIQQLLSE